MKSFNRSSFVSLLLKDQCRTIKICDFGTACAVHTNMTVAQGSVAWMAPEVFQGFNYTEKCDIFSWAISLWQILSRELPYFNLDSPIQNHTYDNQSTIENQSQQSTSQGSQTTQQTNLQGGGAASFRIMWAVHSGERPQFLRGCPAVLEKLLQDCWADQPSQRPSIDRVVETIEPIAHICSRGFSVLIRLPPDGCYSLNYSIIPLYSLYPNDYIFPIFRFFFRWKLFHSKSVPRSRHRAAHFRSGKTRGKSFLVRLSINFYQQKEFFEHQVDVSPTLPASILMSHFDQNTATICAHQATMKKKCDLIDTISNHNREKVKQLPSNSSNVYSVHSEIHVHPPSCSSSTSSTSIFNGGQSTVRNEIEDLIKRFELTKLDPRKIFKDRNLPKEIFNSLPDYEKRFQELVNLISNYWTIGRFPDNQWRMRLQNKHRELLASFNSMHRFIIAKEAQDEGWEYVTQWFVPKCACLCARLVHVFQYLNVFFVNKIKINFREI